MKGIYPAVSYVLLFSVGVVFGALVYGFSGEYVEGKSANIQEAQSGRICAYLADLAQMDAEIGVFVDLGELGLESVPLRVVGEGEFICGGNLTSFGFCQGECFIKRGSDGLRIGEVE